MGIIRNILENTGYLHIIVIISIRHNQCLTQRIFIPEVLLSHLLCNHHGHRFSKSGFGNPPHQGKRKDLQEMLIGIQTVFFELDCIMSEQGLSGRMYPCNLYHFWIFLGQGHRHGGGNDAHRGFTKIIGSTVALNDDAVFILFIFMEGVVAEFPADKEHDQHEAEHTDRKPCNIDE